MSTTKRTEVWSSHLRVFSLPAWRDTARVALVPEQAVLLAGDSVEIWVHVGEGRTLEIVEPGGTVAYAMRGGSARWNVRVEIETAGTLVWHGQPFVVSEGADVSRGTTVDLGAGARALLRETLVLGRARESPGRLVSRTEVRREGSPVLIEELDADIGFGAHRVVDQVLDLADALPVGEDTLTWESGDRMHRWLGDALHASSLPSVRLLETARDA